jgi:hypothetical protein
MNPSRRLIIQMAAFGAATSGLASLHWARAATVQTGTFIQESLRLHSSVKNRTASRAATLAFANELRVNRDNAFKRLMGPAFAPKLSSLPLAGRVAIGNMVFGLVGNASSPALSLSPPQIDDLSRALYTGAMISVVWILGTLVVVRSSDLPTDHPCKEYEEALVDATNELLEAWFDYLECEGSPGSVSLENGIKILQKEESTADDSIGVEGGGDCRDHYAAVERLMNDYNLAVSEYNRCMANS